LMSLPPPRKLAIMGAVLLTMFLASLDQTLVGACRCYWPRQTAGQGAARDPRADQADYSDVSSFLRWGYDLLPALALW
jgi:hypothetical protein